VSGEIDLRKEAVGGGLFKRPKKLINHQIASVGFWQLAIGIVDIICRYARGSNLPSQCSEMHA
jgi:hypothetical protein